MPQYTEREIQHLIQQLEKLDSSAIADVMVRMGLEMQVLSPAFKSTHPQQKLIGPALCAQARLQNQHNTLNPIELDDQVYAACVVVIAAEACDKGALLGDNMLSSMVQKGARGFIVDGGIRDTAELIQGSTPVLYRYTSSTNAYRFFGFSEFEVAIQLEGIWGNVSIHPGDFIFADYDGALVLPGQHLQAIIDASFVHVSNEVAIKAAIMTGMSRRQALEKYPRLQHVKPVNTNA